MSLNGVHTPLASGENETETPAKSTPSPAGPTTLAIATPYKCFAFIVNNALLYMSDVSNIPDAAWQTISNPPKRPVFAADPVFADLQPTYQVLVIDVLRPEPFRSHFGLDQAIQTARRLGTPKNYMIGFGHDLNHEDWVKIGELIGEGCPKDGLESVIEEALDFVSEGKPVWIRPAYDGQLIHIPENRFEQETMEAEGSNALLQCYDAVLAL